MTLNVQRAEGWEPKMSRGFHPPPQEIPAFWCLTPQHLWAPSSHWGVNSRSESTEHVAPTGQPCGGGLQSIRWFAATGRWAHVLRVLSSVSSRRDASKHQLPRPRPGRGSSLLAARGAVLGEAVLRQQSAEGEAACFYLCPREM